MHVEVATWDIGTCLEGVRRGDEEAATLLVAQLGPLVMKIVRSHLPARQSEEDLAQEVFGRVFARLDRYQARPGIPFEHWVARLAVRTCLDVLRAERRRPEIREADLSEGAEDWLEYLAGAVVHPPAAATSEAQELVHRLLSRLSPEDRLVVSMLDLEEKSVREVCEMTGWTAVGVRVRVFRARTRLRLAAKALREEASNEAF